jgi:hypothetical protein
MIGPYAEAVGGGAGRAMPDFPLHKPTTERLFRVRTSPRADLPEGPLTSRSQTYALKTGTAPFESSFSVKRIPKSQSFLKQESDF